MKSADQSPAYDLPATAVEAVDGSWTFYDVVPDPVEDLVEWAGDQVENVGSSVDEHLGNAIDELDEAAARAAAIATTTLVVSGGLTAATAYVLYRWFR